MPVSPSVIRGVTKLPYLGTNNNDKFKPTNLILGVNLFIRSAHRLAIDNMLPYIGCKSIISGTFVHFVRDEPSR